MSLVIGFVTAPIAEVQMTGDAPARQFSSDCLIACLQRWMPMFLRLLAFTCALLIAANCTADPGSAEQRQAVLAGLSKKSSTGKIVTWKVNILNISGDWAFADVTPLDKAGHPLAEQKVAVLHHIHGPGSADKGWKELDLSKVPRDPNEEEYGPGFQRNIRKMFPYLPKEIFQKA
jgi:hypothetical protein